MKKITFAAVLIFLAASLYAQVQQQATVAWIVNPDSPGADPYLCIFGNTIDDIILIDSDLDLGGKVVRYLSQREEFRLADIFEREWARLNTRFFSVHIVQRRLVDDERIFVHYFMVRVYEKVGNNIYFIASNDY